MHSEFAYGVKICEDNGDDDIECSHHLHFYLPTVVVRYGGIRRAPCACLLVEDRVCCSSMMSDRKSQPEATIFLFLARFFALNPVNLPNYRISLIRGSNQSGQGTGSKIL
ncbi:hypothetical protein M5K25_015872 [Dendrobium thyrsiflorum]|uniref:Uncharacterized protein n=1 Tax=Dendrobium thyrsiflorum TaxID=117978 RepID=A0ABD0URF5_DENTH